MAYKQTRGVNLSIPVTGGWCENAVERAFGLTSSEKTGKYASATTAWNAAIGKHTDRSNPGVYVPVYFSITNNAAGHVAILAPDGRVFSASTSGRHAFNIHSSIDDIIRFYGPKLVYRGWAEGVGAYRVAEWVNTPAPAPAPAPGVTVYGAGYINNNPVIDRISKFMRATFPAYTNAKALGPVFGPYLTASIKEFQRRTGLQADGNVGPITMAKLKTYGFKG